MRQHPWALVGPWYRSESIGGGLARNTTAPIFQKYATTDFMDRFIREPQASLKFVCEDFVDRFCVDPNVVVTPETRSQADDSLKLFLDVHSRFYLVVCELHCVAPGFPTTSRDQVCETGFVIRRRVPQIDPSLQAELGKLIRQRNAIKNQIVRLSPREQTADGIIATARKVAAKLTIESAKQNKLKEFEDDLNNKQEKLNQFIIDNDLQLKLQGWTNPPDVDVDVDVDMQDVWLWSEIDDENPQEISEQVFPLYPLIADPTVKDHSAEKRTMWFGLVPTASSDVDINGNSRFDDSDLYEIRCFVRRKKDCCPGKGRNCCHGEIVWSKPTTSYRLASYFDLDGNSHRPINIKLPDIPALKQQAALGPPGRGANGKVIAPPGSGMIFKTDGMEMPTNQGVRSGQQICFFAILLFFFVAYFLFRLFMPIVVFLFQLWFLLTLRFCIPPTINLDVDLAADLKINGPDIDLAFGADAGATLAFTVGGVEKNLTRDELIDELAKGIGTEVGSDAGTFVNDINDALKDSLNSGELTLNELADLYLRMATDFSEDPANDEIAGKLPLAQDGLYYFEPLTMP